MSMSSDSATQIGSCVETAIRLGWRMAQVYHNPPHFEPYEDKLGEQLPPNLPGLKELGDYERGKTLIAEIQHSIHILQ